MTVDEIMAEAKRETPARKHLAHLVELAMQALDLAVEEDAAYDSPSRETFAKHVRERLAQGVMARELDAFRHVPECRPAPEAGEVTMPEKFSRAPFPYFGGKRSVASLVWERFGRPKQFIEPFCGSAAVLLAAPERASLEVIGDQNFYVANFWRCIKFQPRATYEWQDYPVSHVDLDARHRWLTQPDRTAALRASLADPEWPGDPQIAGWWVWGLCAWIGSGWCEHESQVPHVSDAGRGVQSKVPHVGNAGRGVQSKVPHVSDAGRGVADWFAHLAARLERVRVIHGAWDRTLNHHYGAEETAVFLDPPYRAFEGLYQRGADAPVADAVCEWAREHAHLRVALCGHRGDYDLPGWEIVEWSRERNTYGGAGTKDEEAIWFSPPCHRPAEARQLSLLGEP